MNKALIIAPSWPGENSGYCFALNSSINRFKKEFNQLVYCAFTAENISEKIISKFPDVKFIHVPLKENSKLTRFFFSLFSKYPAIVQKFNNRKAISRIELIIRTEKPDKVIVEDLPLAFLIRILKSRIINIPFSLRSHNVLGEAFEGFEKKGNIMIRKAWEMEIKRIKDYEKNILHDFEEVYAITQRDAKEYKNRYNFNVNGVIGVCFERNYIFSKNPDFEYGKKIIHLGTLDLRKSTGMNEFILLVWDKIKSQHEDAVLILAGKNSERFNMPEKGIIGMGFIENENEIMDMGSFFINPQQIGTGVKVKTLFAMLHGKVVVSTKKGIEGIEGQNGKDYLIADNPEEFISCFNWLFSNIEAAKEISKNSRRFIEERYACEEF